MAVEALFVALVLLLAVGGPLLLYGAVSSEAENRATMDRREAEQRVQQQPSWRDGRDRE